MRRNKSYEVYDIKIIKDYREGEMLITVSKNGSFYDEVVFHLRDDKLEARKYLIKMAVRIT